ncbi:MULTISPECIES: glycosyltransferase [Flavobacterium]|uniref:glycosyltransferase n=1 Tax=Flavobacterium TaxID=237 RepID=UPI001FCA6256|nr:MULTISPECIES: glycosyltransferase [Flavobacterium]UOK43755.1 glycosyltransferase [Flavobacterium enshiense]
MIKVLGILETMAYGGVERRRLSLAKYLNKDLFELKIICTKATDELIEQFRQEGVEVIPIGILKSPFQWSQHQKVQKIIATYKPHIVHGAVFEGVTMAAVNGFLMKVPIVIIEETSDPQNRSWRGNLLMKLFSFLCTKAVGVSRASTDYLENVLRIGNEKIQLIENGVALPKVENKSETKLIKERLNLNGKIVIGSVGRMLNDNTKRFSDLIKAFALLVKVDQNVHLILIGDGPEKWHYENIVKELGLEGFVSFEGYQKDVSKYYYVMDIFSLVSAHESFGLVLAEAMLHKLPVVATRVGGMQFIVDDSQTGFLVEKFDVDQIAAQIARLLKDKELRLTFGQNGYQKAMLHYTEEQYVKKVENLYLSLVKR